MALPPAKLIFITILLSASGSFHFGYELIIINPTQFVFKSFLNDSFGQHYGYYLSDSLYRIVWALVLNMLTFGCILGTCANLALANRVGRKRSFALSISASSLGAILSASSYYVNAWELFAIGRFVTGLAMGLTFCLQPMFFTEISSDDNRGFLNAMTSCLSEFGFGLGSIIAMPTVLGTQFDWPWLYWLELAPNAAAILVLPFLVESPKFLLATKDDRMGAQRSLQFYDHKDPVAELKSIEKEIRMERQALGFTDLLKKPYLRKALTISAVFQFAVQFSGITALSFFSTGMFELAGISGDSAAYGTVVVCLQTGLANVVAVILLDRVGRRPLMLLGFSMLILTNIIFVIFFNISAQWSGYICIVGAVVFNFMFGVGPGVIQWFVVSEFLPHNAKAAGQSFAMLCQWIFLCLATAIFLPLSGRAEAYSFFIFIIPLSVSTIYFYFVFPETKNKTISDIVALLGYRPDESERIKDKTVFIIESDYFGKKV